MNDAYKFQKSVPSDLDLYIRSVNITYLKMLYKDHKTC